MRFETVYRLVYDFQEANNRRMVLLSEASLRIIYEGIIAGQAHDCLELGTGYGASTCVMAAAVEEIGGGTVTTVDWIDRPPFGVRRLSEITGLSRYIEPVLIERGYNAYLRDVLRRQTKDRLCTPCFDFCFLDGAHEWDADALATLIAVKLLRPGGWLMLDDLNFKSSEVEPGSALPEVGMVFDLLVQTHPDLERCMVTNEGHIGWARKVGRPPPLWLPGSIVCGPVAAGWSARFDGVGATQNAHPFDGLVLEPQDRTVLLRAMVTDPNLIIPNPLLPLRAIDFVTLRVRLVEPDIAMLQLFWIGAEDENFTEAHSLRYALRRTGEAQDVTFCFTGPEAARTIRLFRLDPGDAACEVVLESVTVGGM